MIVRNGSRLRGSVWITGGVLAAFAVGASAACTNEAGGRDTPAGVEQSCADGAETGGLPVVVPPTLPPGTQPTFPAPGGGPRVVDVFALDDTTYLLNPVDGTYHAMPWRVVLAPDGTRVAIADDGRIGMADRSALIAQGESAITWTDLVPASGLLWSPDGTAVLTTSVTRANAGSDEVTYTIQRFDVDSATSTHTTIRGTFLGGRVGWAADSLRYVALLAATNEQGWTVPGPMQYVNPDGTLGPQIQTAGGLVGGAESYSPSKQKVILDSSELMLNELTCSRILDVTSGEALMILSPGERPAGWYDDTSFVRFDPYRTRLEVVDVASKTVVKQIDLSGIPGVRWVQIGSAAGLTGTAATRGF